jgi:tetratricopeptide (TPR) repeat protein
MLLQPEVDDWKMGLTQAVMRQGKYQETITLCDELLTEDPSRTDLWLLQANARIGLGQPLEAARNLEIVHRLGGGTTASRYTLGDVYVNESMWDLAAKSYQDALAHDPKQPPAQPLARVEALSQRGALEQAEMLLAAIRATYGDRLDEDQQRRALKLGARIAVAAGDDADAVPVLEEIVALDPLDGEALMLLAQHYTKSGDEDRALFYYERAGSLEKYEAEAKVRQAQLLVNQSRYAEALPLLERAQEISPRDDVARYREQVERVARSKR